MQDIRMTCTTDICVTVLAHNEEQRISACLRSLPTGLPGMAVHVVVNGSSDRTAQRARACGRNDVTVHEFALGGKARSWNRFLFDTLDEFAGYHIFIDGDVILAPKAIEALMAALDADPSAQCAAAMPLNGRSVEQYRAQMKAEHGLFGALYALRGDFLARMKRADIRLPDDLIGDDGLICAMVKTGLGDESRWDDRRVIPCEDSGFTCETTRLFSWATLRNQYRRMINYSVRHFQNRIISEIMRGKGPSGLPRMLSSLYKEKMPELQPRHSLVWWYFDRQALKRMRSAI